jgi:hypothetical protein
MSISLYVQIIRNFLCVLNALLPADSSWKWISFPTAPPPLNEVNNFEWAIGFTQAAAVFFLLISSYVCAIDGYRMISKAKKSLICVDRLSVESDAVGSAEHTILRHHLLQNYNKGYTIIYNGLADFIIGISFVFLVTNNLHLRGSSHPLPLIQALIAMEVALIYVLMMLWNTFLTSLRRSLKCRNLALKIQESQGVKLTFPKIIELASSVGFIDNLMECFLLFQPNFQMTYRRNQSLLSCLKDTLINMQTNFNQPLSLIKSSSSSSSSSCPSPSPTSTASSPTSEETMEISTQCLLETARYAGMEAMFDFLLFTLNFIAFFGYFMSLIAYYYPHAYEVTPHESMELIMVRLSLGYMTPSYADWFGNIMGDAAWGIEPIIILMRPMILQQMKKKQVTKKNASFCRFRYSLIVFLFLSIY